MDSRYEYDHSKMSGVDVNIEISLKEYGIAWIEEEMADDVLFYYGIKTNNNGEWIRFDMCSFKKDLDVRGEFNWIDKKDWKGIRSYTGLKQYEFDALPLTQKIETLNQYYGFENIFGSSYWEGLTYEEIFNFNKEV